MSKLSLSGESELLGGHIAGRDYVLDGCGSVAAFFDRDEDDSPENGLSLRRREGSAVCDRLRYPGILFVFPTKVLGGKTSQYIYLYLSAAACVLPPPHGGKNSLAPL